MSITEIADSLNLSHPAIVQIVSELTKKNLVKASTDKNDGRKRMIALSPAGKKTLAQIEPILASIKEENRKWLDTTKPNLLQILNQLEQALDEQDMYQRVKLSLLLSKPD